MKPGICLCATALFFAVVLTPVQSRTTRHKDPRNALRAWELLREPSDAGMIAGARADTTWYGRFEVIDGEYYALSSSIKEEVMWTFDRGDGPFDPPPPLLHMGGGWSVRDMTLNRDMYFRTIDRSLDLGVGVDPPIISGERSLWVGIDQPAADDLCWPCGAGYGNEWCQRVASEPYVYDGSGSVNLRFSYWSQAEPCFDGTQVYLHRSDGSELLLNEYPTGECPENGWYRGGTITGSIGSHEDPTLYERLITHEEIAEAQEIRIILEFKSDAAYSDEDCSYPTLCGPFGLDDLSIQGGGIEVFYDFETGLQGWSPMLCNPIGDFADIVDVGCYTILDPCECELAGNILEMHALLCDEGVHPIFQHQRIYSPICDLGSSEPKTIFMDIWSYTIIPPPPYGAVMVRPGWHYYPWTCDVTGEVGWSPRVGFDSYVWLGSDPLCAVFRTSATDPEIDGIPVPASAEKVIAVMELKTFDRSSGDINFTPLWDNIAIGATSAPVNAPLVHIDEAARYQDVGSYPSDLFDPRAPGPANVSWDVYWGIENRPERSGDSLVIVGPMPGQDPNHRWESKLWWRVARRAPFQADRENGVDTRYKIWKDRVSDGKLIDRPDRPQFTWGIMDSAEAVITYPYKFISCFREDDDDFVGEGNEETEMIWDDVLYPGTRIEYFITSNYIGTPHLQYYLPDTSGANFYEFEILPGLRTSHVPNCGGVGFDHCVFQPAVLYVNARDTELVVENALRTVLNGLDPCRNEEGCAIPSKRNWDRYEPGLVPLARGGIAGSNNGMTLNQLLGYRAILVSTGPTELCALYEADYELFDQWLRNPSCDANLNRQVLIMNGDKVGENLEYWEYGAYFMAQTLGATLLCDAFNGYTVDPDCGQENDSFCVRYLPVAGGPFPSESDIDAWGSHCPNMYGLNVFGLLGGMGNRYYSSEDGLKEMAYAQVVNEDLSASGNYRTVLDGVSWTHMTLRNPGGEGAGRCPNDLPSVVDAAISEIGAALKWGFGVDDFASIPKLASAEILADCQNTWDSLPAEALDDAASLHRVTRLYAGRPNPSGRSTTIPYSLASFGLLEIAIYDVSGRLVRTLVNENVEAGAHTATWDGKDDAGHDVGSGIYWCRMRAGTYESTMKMVTLR